jgi:hypothetical protein
MYRTVPNRREIYAFLNEVL